MKVAIVHDWLVIPAGAERIVKILCELFPQADLYSLVYDENTMGQFWKEKNIKTSFIQKMPWGKEKYPSYLPLMPLAIEQFDLTGYDLVISSSSSVAKGVLTDSKTLHICYCHTPMRYAWDQYHGYLNQNRIHGLKRALIIPIMNYIRMWDRLSADRADYFIANSYNVAKRINKHYRREAAVIHPPVNSQFYKPVDKIEQYFLVVSRLVPYKKIDLVVEVFNELNLPLVIVGDGSEYGSLKKMAKGNIHFTGRLSDEEIKGYYAKCRAFIFPGEEDFGITPLEAMASGRPVIAYGVGGVRETVIENETGLFFDKQCKKALTDAISKFLQMEKTFDSLSIRAHAEKFSEDRFKTEILDFINQKYSQYKNNS